MEPLFTSDEPDSPLREEMPENTLLTRWLLPLVKGMVGLLLAAVWLLLSAAAA